jgi:hypothetical protein
MRDSLIKMCKDTTTLAKRPKRNGTLMSYLLIAGMDQHLNFKCGGA